MAAPRRSRTSGGALLLAAPGLLCLGALLVAPLVLLLWESLLPHVPGRVGASGGGPTLANYAELSSPAYLLYFYDSFRIGFIACLVALILGYPVAFAIASARSGALRRLAVVTLVAMMFLSVLARVYAIALTLSPIGFLRPLANLLGLNPNGRPMIEILVVMGLLHLTLPIAALTLLGPLQSINPRLVEAAQSLGAARWRAHLSVTLPLSSGAALAAFLICYSLCVSAFIIPMVLGKGRVLFVANLVFNRFSEAANFPGGAAIAIVLLAVTMAVVWLLSTLTRRPQGAAA